MKKNNLLITTVFSHIFLYCLRFLPLKINFYIDFRLLIVLEILLLLNNFLKFSIKTGQKNIGFWLLHLLSKTKVLFNQQSINSFLKKYFSKELFEKSLVKSIIPSVLVVLAVFFTIKNGEIYKFLIYLAPLVIYESFLLVFKKVVSVLGLFVFSVITYFVLDLPIDSFLHAIANIFLTSTIVLGITLLLPEKN